jgi:hypothetical protein
MSLNSRTFRPTPMRAKGRTAARIGQSYGGFVQH